MVFAPSSLILTNYYLPLSGALCDYRMAKYKNIKSVIHNWADSFLSIENYSDQSYFSQVLFEVANKYAAKKIVINILTSDISPRKIITPNVSEFTKYCPWSFAKLLASQNVEPSMVSSARLEIVYDFDAPIGDTTGYSFSNPESAPLAIKYQATAIAIDNRGVEHSAIVKEWWRS